MLISNSGYKRIQATLDAGVVPVGGEPLLVAVHQGVDGGEQIPLEVVPLPLGGEGAERRRAVMAHQTGQEVAHQVYCADRDNHVFLMEDVSYLKPARAQLSKGVESTSSSSRMLDRACLTMREPLPVRTR